MEIIRRLKEIISRFENTEKLDMSFAFPYSSDPDIKRQQVWDNLQKGLLFEDNGILIPWLMPFNQIDNFKEKRHDSGDRTQWYLGQRIILDGYKGHFEVMKWMWLPWTNPITEVSENLGFDYEGMKKFHDVKNHVTNLLGEPTKIELENFGSFDLGVIQWQKDLVILTLVGIEHFACRYSFSIGLVRDRNEDHFNKTIEDLKASGFTEEDLGK